jgi:hypothetical protein
VFGRRDARRRDYRSVAGIGGLHCGVAVSVVGQQSKGLAMTDSKRILAVIDPTAASQPAAERAALLAKRLRWSSSSAITIRGSSSAPSSTSLGSSKPARR